MSELYKIYDGVGKDKKKYAVIQLTDVNAKAVKAELGYLVAPRYNENALLSMVVATIEKNKIAYPNDFITKDSKGYLDVIRESDVAKRIKPAK